MPVHSTLTRSTLSPLSGNITPKEPNPAPPQSGLRRLTDGHTAPQLSKLAVPDGYEVLCELGAGATAVVWLARDRKLGRLVALKAISLPVDWRMIQRLMREVHAAAILRHPNIVTVDAMDATDTHVFLAMDFLAGGDLRKRLARGLPPPKQSAEIVRKLAHGLAHAHANDVLHRDIKPSNVLFDAEGEPRLADFGLSVPIGSRGDPIQPRHLAELAAYLAPELENGDWASPASEVYSLGALLYECLTGRPPFSSDTTFAGFMQVADSAPVPPHLLRAHVPRDLEMICLKCLEKSPERRYASAAALRQDLEHFVRSSPGTTRPLTSGRPDSVREPTRSTAPFVDILPAA